MYGFYIPFNDYEIYLKNDYLLFTYLTMFSYLTLNKKIKFHIYKKKTNYLLFTNILRTALFLFQMIRKTQEA